MSHLPLQSQRWLSSASGSLDQVACLKDIRSVIRLSGPTLIHFLQVSSIKYLLEILDALLVHRINAEIAFKNTN
jgi:hypothetical protein